MARGATASNEELLDLLQQMQQAFGKLQEEYVQQTLMFAQFVKQVQYRVVLHGRLTDGGLIQGPFGPIWVQ